MKLIYKNIDLNDNKNIDDLIYLSSLWKNENISYGMVVNTKDDLHEPIIGCYDNDKLVGYIMGHYYIEDKKRSYIEIGSKCFDIDELYVIPQYRNKKIGETLYEKMLSIIDKDTSYDTLATSTKDYKKILHFYVDVLGLTFHSAFLIKKL